MFYLLILVMMWGTIHAREFTWDDLNAMDEYVHRNDGWFSWRIIETHRYDRYNSTVYVVNMTSQKWMDDEYTTRSRWWHIMGIGVPDEARFPDAGMLAITGGRNREDEPPPDHTDLYNMLAAQISSDCGCAAGYIRQVPNQSMQLSNDPNRDNRSEDRIIAWTWKTYVDGYRTNPEVILRMPMTKSAKRALDTITEVARFTSGGKFNPQKFGVTGGSKRGWTSWSLAATDKRVAAMFPLVFSLLDINESAMNHFRALDGGWSWALRDYWNAGILKHVFHPKMQDVLDYEDMRKYFPRFTMPKLMVSAVGDEFFSLTDSHPWWDDLMEPKHILMVPNAQHTLAPHYLMIYRTMMGMWMSILQDKPLPRITWKRSEHRAYNKKVGQIDIYFEKDFLPTEVRAYHATTAARTEGRRDFRMVVSSERPCTGTRCDTEPHIYRWRLDEENIKKISNTHWRIRREQPEPGLYTGMFIQADFEGADGYTMTFTSEVQMIPDTFPAEACTQDPDCHTHMT